MAVRARVVNLSIEAGVPLKMLNKVNPNGSTEIHRDLRARRFKF
jgi:hypothetical protein